MEYKAPFREVLLLKCGEMVLKGLNRSRFEDRLLSDLRTRLAPCGAFSLGSRQSTVTVEPRDTNFDMDRAEALCRRVFGLVSVCRAAQCEKDMAAIEALAPAYLADALAAARSFKVEAKRSDKRFSLNSMEIMAQLGGVIAEKFPHLRVDVNSPEATVHVEIRDHWAYIHPAPAPGAGGLPVGINGRAALLISGGIDSPVAGYLMARRGLSLHAIHFFSYPYTSLRALEKVRELLRILAASAGPIPLSVVSFTKIQEQIRANCPEDLFTLVMRRFMMRIASEIAAREDCGALITGESLGQVASQTLNALAVTDAVCDRPVFRPLIGLDKSDIVVWARKIGSFDTSILPYEDCCTVFTPRHPKTRPHIAQAEAAEEKLDVAGLVAEALAGVERERLEA